MEVSNMLPKEPYKCATDIPTYLTDQPKLPLGIRRGHLIQASDSSASGLSLHTHHQHVLNPPLHQHVLNPPLHHCPPTPRSASGLIPYEASSLHVSTTRSTHTPDNHRDVIDASVSGSSNDCLSTLSFKPLAMVMPQRASSLRHDQLCQHTQTDGLSIDLNSLLHMEDFCRSQRIQGLSSPPQKETHAPQTQNETNRIEELQNLLQRQNKVNQDLKKLLIASVGEELTHKFESLSTDCLQLNTELNTMKSERHEVTQSFEEVAIERDLWRSKFVASRVMVDELASWKGQLMSRYTESISAVQALLQERHQLRSDLVETHHNLHQMKSVQVNNNNHALTPFVLHTEEGVLKNTIELSISTRQLASHLLRQNKQSTSPCYTMSHTLPSNQQPSPTSSEQHQHSPPTVHPHQELTPIKTSSTPPEGKSSKVVTSSRPGLFSRAGFLWSLCAPGATLSQDVRVPASGEEKKAKVQIVDARGLQPQEHKEYTHGEKLALQTLRNRVLLSADPTQRYISSYSTQSSHNFEKVSDNCHKCRGEIHVL